MAGSRQNNSSKSGEKPVSECIHKPQTIHPLSSQISQDTKKASKSFCEEEDDPLACHEEEIPYINGRRVVPSPQNASVAAVASAPQTVIISSRGVDSTISCPRSTNSSSMDDVLRSPSPLQNSNISPQPKELSMNSSCTPRGNSTSGNSSGFIKSQHERVNPETGKSKGNSTPTKASTRSKRSRGHVIDNEESCANDKLNSPQSDAGSTTSNGPLIYESGTGGCLGCGADDDHANLLICESCNAEYHTYCLDPPLRSVPEGDFYCDKCKVFHKEENDSDDDGLDIMVDAIGPEYTSRFGEIIWAAGGIGFGWWPACIYDPRLTVGVARSLAKKHLGKKHLVYFFECFDAPFTVLTNSKLATWEEGFLDEYDLGKQAKAMNKPRGILFERALQVANVEHGKPVDLRLDWNHPKVVNGFEGAGAVSSGGRKRAAAQTDITTTTTGSKKKRGKGAATASDINSATEGSDKAKKQHIPLTRAIGRRRGRSGAPLNENNELVSPQEALALATALELSKTEAQTKEPQDATPTKTKRSEVVIPTKTKRSEGVIPTKTKRSDGVISMNRERRPTGTLVVSKRSNLKAALDALPSVLIGASATEQPDGKLFLKLLKKGTDGTDAQQNIGFVILNSRRTSSFRDARTSMEEELDLLPWSWKFYVPKLGPVSRKQEGKLNVLEFMSSTTNDVRLGDGTPCNPLRLIVQDFSEEENKVIPDVAASVPPDLAGAAIVDGQD